MDLLGVSSVVVRRRRRTLMGQALAALTSVTAVLGVVGAADWPGTGGDALERLVVSADEQPPELPPSLLRSDDRRPPVSATTSTDPSAPAVSTTTATSVVLVEGPPADVKGTERAMEAYRSAADQLAAEQPGCRLSWGLLAGIGLVESGHGTVFDGTLDAGGKAVPPILGPRLNGNGFALIRDTDGGLYDGDVELDRAVGPMQFIPGTWKRWGSDGDGDGAADPQDVDDAALAAGRYLCASGARLDQPDGLIRAVFSYNHSFDYVRLVLTVTARYLGVPPSALGVDRLPAPPPPPVEVPVPVDVVVAPPPGAAPEPAPEPQEHAGPSDQPTPAQAGPDEPGPDEPADTEPEPGEPGPGEPTPPTEPAPGPDPAPVCPVLPTDPPSDDPDCQPTPPQPTGAPSASDS